MGTDSGEEDLTAATSDINLDQNTTDDAERQKNNNKTLTRQLITKIVPENLVIKNQTHGKLNGKLTITNSWDQEEETVMDLFFQEENQQSAKEEDTKTINIESATCKILYSISTVLVCIFITIL